MMIKICNKCDSEKSCTEFSVKRITKNGVVSYASRCKACTREYSKSHYKLNSIKRRAQTKNYTETRGYHINREKVWEFLKNSKCVDCGNSDPRVLEFDHVRGNKLYNISDMVCRNFRWSKILDEINKCEIRCANCHAIKTATQYEYYLCITDPDKYMQEHRTRNFTS